MTYYTRIKIWRDAMKDAWENTESKSRTYRIVNRSVEEQ